MTSKEQLLQELETLPEQLIDEVLDYIGFIKNRQPKKLRKVSLSDDWWDNLFRFTPDFQGRTKSTLTAQSRRYFLMKFILDTNICIYIIKEKLNPTRNRVFLKNPVS